MRTVKGKVAASLLVAIVFSLAVILYFSLTAYGSPITPSSFNERIGSFTGPEAGSSQDDNVKASLDLAHTDLDVLIADNLDLNTFTSGISDGDVFFVSSTIDGAAGTTWATAVGTLDEAIGKCTADNGDYIFIEPGHTETLGASSDGVDCDVAGVTIIGLGEGELRPLFDYDTATDEFVIGADDVKISNCQFKANVDSVVKAIDVEAGAENFVIEKCRFYVESTGTDEFDDVIIVAAGCDNGRIIDCDCEMGAAESQSFINTAGTDYLLIKGNRVSGDFGVACIEDATAASTWITIQDNILMNGTTGGTAGLNTTPCITLKSDTSAMIVDNHCFTNVANAELAIVAADGFMSGNTYNETEGPSGEQEIGLKVGHVYTRKMTSVVTATTDQMFTVAGGRIEIISLFGECTTVMASDPGDLSIEIDATDGTNYDNDFSTSVTINTLGVGDVVRFTNAIDEGVLDLTVNVNAGQTLSWFCPPGEIEQTTTSTGTGGITWYMTFRPLEPGVTVVSN